MTYWYLGLCETIGDLRALTPATQIILGGIHATLCSSHARSLGADLVSKGSISIRCGEAWASRRITIKPPLGALSSLADRGAQVVGRLPVSLHLLFGAAGLSEVSRPTLERSLAELAFLIRLGADPARVHAYLIVGHPQGNGQDMEESMYFAHSQDIKIMLSEFSPIPGTPDGEYCRRWVDLDEPLCHNKTAFVARFLGMTEINRLKHLANRLNAQLRTSDQGAATPSDAVPA